MGRTIRRIAALDADPRHLEAASRLVRHYERDADGEEDGAPFWFGWVLHEVFLLGIAYAQRKAAEGEKER